MLSLSCSIFCRILSSISTMHKKKNYRFNVQKQKKNSRYIYSNCSPTSEVHAALTLLFPAHLYSDRSISLELLSIFLSDSLNYLPEKNCDNVTPKAVHIFSSVHGSIVSSLFLSLSFSLLLPFFQLSLHP